MYRVLCVSCLKVELHHYCSRVNDEVTQCAVYESDKSDARLLGVEYVISERLFRSLPEEEQIYWHSHATDIKSGTHMSLFLALRFGAMCVHDPFVGCSELHRSRFA